MTSPDRYKPCEVLQEKNIACTCWFEDAIAHYGVPTVLFDLYLLVQDKEAAVQVLLDHGWAPAPSRPNDTFCFFSDKKCKPFHRLVHPERPHVHTFLLNAADWAFPVERLGGGQQNDGSTTATAPFYPQLPELVDTLIDSVLDTQEGEPVSDHLTMMLSYLYGYVADLKQDKFANQLAYEHRQFHYDTKAMTVFSLRFIRHERNVRQQLRDGTIVPHYDPYNNDRECLS